MFFVYSLHSLQLFWIWIAIPCPILFSSHDLNFSCVYFIPSETQKKRKRSGIVIINSTHQQIFIKYTAFIRRFNVCNCKYISSGSGWLYLYKKNKQTSYGFGLAPFRPSHRIGSYFLTCLPACCCLAACMKDKIFAGKSHEKLKMTI